MFVERVFLLLQQRIIKTLRLILGNKQLQLQLTKLDKVFSLELEKDLILQVLEIR